MRQAPASSPLRRSEKRAKLGFAAWNAEVAEPADRVWPCSASSACSALNECRAIEARIISRSSCSVMGADGVDDADDRSVDWRRLFSERFACRAAFEDDEHLLAHAGADAVDGEERRAARRVVHIQRLDEQQLGAFELLVLPGRHDRADHFSN